MSYTQEYADEAIYILSVELPAAIKKVREAKSLEELCHGLQERDDAKRDAVELMNKIARIDRSNLPTFGGEEPPLLSGAFSWDNERMLIHFGGWDVVPRPGTQREEID